MAWVSLLPDEREEEEDVVVGNTTPRKRLAQSLAQSLARSNHRRSRVSRSSASGRRPQLRADVSQQVAVDEESTVGEEEPDLTGVASNSWNMSVTVSSGTSSSISTAGSASPARVVGATTSEPISQRRERSERISPRRKTWTEMYPQRPSAERRKGWYSDAKYRTCTRCCASYKGFGHVCATCRKAGPKGDVKTCKGCSDFFRGFGKSCKDCLLAPEPDMVEEVEALPSLIADADKILMTQEQLEDFTRKAVEMAIKVQTEKHSQQLEDVAKMSREAMVVKFSRSESILKEEICTLQNMLKKLEDQYNQKEEDSCGRPTCCRRLEASCCLGWPERA